MNIKRNPISARDMVFFFIITTPLRVFLPPLPVCPFVRPSVCYALSSLTIGRNPTKFGVRNFHMSGLCDSTFWGHPPGAQGRVQRSTIIFKKVNFKDFYTKLYVCSKK